MLMSAEAARRCVWVCRAGAAPEPETEGADPAHHAELQRRLANLQKDLKVRAATTCGGIGKRLSNIHRLYFDWPADAVVSDLITKTLRS